jgi:hypothetical protein
MTRFWKIHYFFCSRTMVIEQRPWAVLLGACVAFSTVVVCKGAFVVPGVVPTLRKSGGVFMGRNTPDSQRTRLWVSADEAIATLDASQATSVAAIADAIPDLAAKSDLSWLVEDGVTVSSCVATLDGRDAAGPANIAWLSSLCVREHLSSLTIFNGPLTDVPNLLSRACISNDKLTLALDFRARAYGAYEMADAEGNYPGPDVLGRKAFEYSGNRKDFDTKFGTEEVMDFVNGIVSTCEGAVVVGQDLSELELLTRGPLALSITMPLTESNVAAVAEARSKAASYWLGWALDDSHTHRPGAPINSQFVYDTKYRQNSYGAILPVYTSLFGPDDGAKVAAADSGPLDEGYVGGGS